MSDKVIRARLEKLGRYLANLPREKNDKNFSMEIFYEHCGVEESVESALDIAKSHYCGTVACALGHAVIPLRDEILQIQELYGQERYGELFDWGTLSFNLFGLDHSDNEWSFLFGAHWGCFRYSEYEQSAYAAADRIAYYLRSGPATGDWIGEAARAGWVSQEESDKRIKELTRDSLP